MSLVIFSFFYNRECEVNDSIKSLLEAAPGDSQVILVNDGSTDNTLEQLNYFKNDPRVTVINQVNQGFSKSLNSVIPKILKKNKSKFLAIHGSGDLCSKDKFIKQLTFLNENNDVVALGTGFKTISKTSGAILKLNDEFVEASPESLINSVPFTHGTVVYRTDAFFKAGGYKEVFKYCQDWDLYFRLVEIGRVVRLPEVLYTKFIFEDGASFKPSKKLEQIKYKELVTSRKNMDAECYNDILSKVSNFGINKIYPNSDFVAEFKNAQKSLIKKGELKLAQEWSVLLYEITKNEKQKAVKKLLDFLILIKIPSFVLSRMYKVLARIKNTFNDSKKHN